jgi:hypothetical protein
MENAQCYQGMLFMICTALTCTLIPIYTVVYMHHRSDIQSIRKIGGGLKLLHVLSERMDSEMEASGNSVSLDEQKKVSEESRSTAAGLLEEFNSLVRQARASSVLGRSRAKVGGHADVALHILARLDELDDVVNRRLI